MRQSLASRLLLPGMLVCVGLVSIYLSNGTRLGGDEIFYSAFAQELAKAIIAALRLESVDLPALGDRIIGHGWFAPGMGIVLTPVQLLFVGDAPVYATRAYATIVNLTLVWLIVREVQRLGGTRRTAIACILFPCAVPYYLFYLGMLWADLIAVHLALLVLLQLERRVSQSQGTQALSGWYAVGLGLLLGATALVRPQFVFLPAIAIVRIALHKLRSPREGSWASVGKASSLMIVSFVVVLAPWNYAINEKFGSSFMTTSTYLADLFHDADFVRSARSGGRASGNLFNAVHEKIERDARAAGRSFSEQADFEREKLPKTSSSEQGLAIQNSLKAFYFRENRFLEKFLAKQAVSAKFSNTGPALLELNSVAWRLLLSLGLLAFCVPVFPRRNDYLLSLSLKGTVFLLTLQPFFIGGHGRYYVATSVWFLLGY